MKALNLLAGLALVSALPMTAADVVPDVLTFDYGDGSNYYGVDLSSVDSMKIWLEPRNGGFGGTLTVIDKFSHDPYNPDEQKTYTRSYRLLGADGVSILKGVLSLRPADKLPTPYFIPSLTELVGLNEIHLQWSSVEGAAGYELSWSDSYNVLEPTTVRVDGTSYSMPGCQYGTYYQFRVRALHPTDPELNSDFTGRQNFIRDPYHYIYTEQRYEVPELLKVTGRTNDSFTVAFDLTCRDDYFKENFEVVDGKFVADKIRLKEYKASGNMITDIDLTAADKEAGTMTLSGLTPAAKYSVALINSSKPDCDAPYNTCIVNLLGNASEISADDLDRWFEANTEGVADITLFLDAYNAGTGELPGEGSVINLRGGKTYILSANANIFKGITFRTDAADEAAGNRAVIDMALHNFNYAETVMGTASSVPVLIGKIVFENIDFMNTGAQNYATESATSNYFMNGLSYGNVGHEYESIELRGCTFTGFIRGLVRFQGQQTVIFDHFIIDNCLFYDCGYYDASGRGYAWFAGAGVGNQNMFKDLRFTNNTIYDSPRTSLISDNNKSLTWPEDVSWNITVENNTFVNFSTRSTGRYFFDLRYLPAGSKISFQRNLIVLASDDDARDLQSGGADIRTSVTYEIKDNYSVGCRDAHLVDNGIFTNGAFSLNRNSFGAYPEGNLGTPDDLVVKVGSTPLRATDLFPAPNPPAEHKAPANIMEALKYKQTPEVLNHEIYTKGIGDPRWRN